jgi:type II secretory pathway pseudopilin PulG
MGVHSTVRTVSGFALLEVVTASAIVATMAAGAAVVLELAIHTTQLSRARTMETMGAAEKMEQLRSLRWSHTITSGPAISMSDSDVTTDISNHPQTDDGPGLLTSPAGTLTANVTGYVDYLDAYGRWIGSGPAPPPAAVYIRRWSVRPLSSDPDNVLVFEVIVGTRGPAGGLLANSVRLITMEARK